MIHYEVFMDSRVGFAVRVPSLLLVILPVRIEEPRMVSTFKHDTNMFMAVCLIENFAKISVWFDVNCICAHVLNMLGCKLSNVLPRRNIMLHPISYVFARNLWDERIVRIRIRKQTTYTQ